MLPVYRVLLRPRAVKQLAAIPEPHRSRLAEAIDALAYNPRPHGCKKLMGAELFRIRRGDYRIIYAVDDEKVVVTITKAAHRKEAYR